jgi:hypothetical protein
MRRALLLTLLLTLASGGWVILRTQPDAPAVNRTGYPLRRANSLRLPPECSIKKNPYFRWQPREETMQDLFVTEYCFDDKRNCPAQFVTEYCTEDNFDPPPPPSTLVTLLRCLCGSRKVNQD